LSCRNDGSRVFKASINSCVCPESYIEDLIGKICTLKCHYSCKTCNFALLEGRCNECEIGELRIYNRGFCRCAIGYYNDDKLETCEKCLQIC